MDEREQERVSGTDTGTDIPSFVVPRMYYYLDNTELLLYLKEKLIPIGPILENSFSVIADDDIC